MQNNKFHYWQGEYAREIPVIIKDGLYYIEDEDEIYGWMEIEDNNQLKPLDELGINAILSQYKQSPPVGKLERRTIPKKDNDIKTDWLNKENPAENFFMQLYGKDPQQINNFSEHVPYYKINSDFLFNVGEASNELHRMFLEATNRVIHNDELLTRFGIPNSFWNRIRHSWINDQDFTINGRLDFAFDGKQLKLFEYNADSSTGLFECAIIQKKWPEAVGLSSTFTPVRRLHSALINTWKKLNITTKVHLFIDDNEEEMLTALYMQSITKEVGIESKICVGTDQLYWKDDIIVDNDGEPIKLTWKLWTWDAIFQDYLDATKERDLDNEMINKHPRISDVFFHDQIKVIEPLWKMITSNKALLPLLCQMYPNHPNLLRSEWNLTNELKHIPFVKKPTTGHHGQNITLYGPQGDFIIAATTGYFSDCDNIYQELFSRKSDSGYHPIINSWIIRGNYAGLCIREDQNLISNNKSPMTPCCIIWEEEK
jgi:trypanothione synthetase/amidase